MRRNFLYSNKLKEHSKSLRNRMTRAEKKLWYEFLRDCNYRFLRQRPIDNYIVDFYCPSLKLIIEIDGASHIDEKGKNILYDKKREEKLNSLGITIIRFWNMEVFNGIESVAERIMDFIEMREDEIKSNKNPHGF